MPGEQAAAQAVLNFAERLSRRVGRRLEGQGHWRYSDDRIQEAAGAITERICWLWGRRGVAAIDCRRARRPLSKHCARIAARVLQALDCGMSGRKGSEQKGEHPRLVRLSESEPALEEASLQAWVDGEHPPPQTEPPEPERGRNQCAAEQWVRATLLDPLTDEAPAKHPSPARRAAIRAAERRVALVAHLLRGDDLLTAAGVAGYASLNAAGKSFRRDCTFERLIAAIDTLPHIRPLRAKAEAADIALAQAERQLQKELLSAPSACQGEDHTTGKAAHRAYLRAGEVARLAWARWEKVREEAARLLALAAKAFWGSTGA